MFPKNYSPSATSSVAHNLPAIKGPHCALGFTDFDSCLATSSLRSFSMKLESDRFSVFARATSLAFSERSIFNEIVVSFMAFADSTA
jgi:hypothetical protein